MADRAYRYCPLCSTHLEARTHMDQLRPTCPACGFIYFRDPKVAVIAFVTCAEGLLLIRRGINPAKGKWALPGGYVDAHELPVPALHRELQEEVGLAIAVHDLLDIFPMQGPSQSNQGFVMVFGAQPVDAAQRLVVGDDAVEAAWFARTEIPDDLAFASTRVMIERWRVGPSE